VHQQDFLQLYVFKLCTSAKPSSENAGLASLRRTLQGLHLVQVMQLGIYSCIIYKLHVTRILYEVTLMPARRTPERIDRDLAVLDRPRSRPTAPCSHHGTPAKVAYVLKDLGPCFHRTCFAVLRLLSRCARQTSGPVTLTAEHFDQCWPKVLVLLQDNDSVVDARCAC
jgi:hypothetical protein